MENINDNNTKSDFAYWLKQFSSMKEKEFDEMNLSDLTILQRIAYNYVNNSKTDAKIAEKVLSLIQWYEVDSKWSMN